MANEPGTSSTSAPAGAGAGPLRLEHVEGPSHASLDIPPDASTEVIVGRDERCAVHLDDTSVSRRHAEFRADGEGWTVRDIESRNGVFVNTIRLESGEHATLTSGDLLGFGPWTFRVVCDRAHAGPAETDEPDGTDLPPDTASLTPIPEDSTATRATIFVRMRADRKDVRELSWQEFTDRYASIIMAFARRAGMNANDADDILQDVLLGFFRVADGFQYDPSKGRFRGYLKRITLNAIRTRWRKERPVVAVDVAAFADDPSTADNAWDNEWTRQALERALAEARLECEQRTWDAFDQYGRRGVPAEEVARHLKMTVDNVRLAKSRVARKVRTIVQRIRAEEG